MDMSCRSSDSAIAIACVLAWLFAGCATPPVDVTRNPREIVDEVWLIVRENFFDSHLAGVDWNAARDRCLRRIDDEPSNAVASVNAMLDELRTSHTRLYARGEPGYYELLDIYRSALGDDLKRVFPDGVVKYPRTSAAGERVEVEPLKAFLESTRSSVRVIELAGRRLGYVFMPCWTGEAFQDLLTELLNDEPLRQCDGLILDLRGGWGGANPDAIHLFGCDSPTLELIAREGQVTRLESEPPSINPDRQWRKPVVLLVDEGTRSGKEVFAYAFKKHRRGVVVGTRTAGAVVGGKPFLLRGGDLLIVATHDVRLDGLRLEGTGVQPDVVVDRMPTDGVGTADPQLDAAVRLATEVPAPRSMDR